MADAPAVRQARYRRHRAGDHSLCKRGRCPAAADRPPPLVIAPAARELDSRAELEALAWRLIAVTVADPENTNAARALVDVLRALPPPPGELDPVEKIQAQVAAELAAHRAAAAVSNVSLIREGK